MNEVGDEEINKTLAEFLYGMNLFRTSVEDLWERDGKLINPIQKLPINFTESLDALVPVVEKLIKNEINLWWSEDTWKVDCHRS